MIISIILLILFMPAISIFISGAVTGLESFLGFYIPIFDGIASMTAFINYVIFSIIPMELMAILYGLIIVRIIWLVVKA